MDRVRDFESFGGGSIPPGGTNILLTTPYIDCDMKYFSKKYF